MIRLSPLLLFASFLVPAQAADIKGILMDEMCSGTADLRISGATGTLAGGRIVAEAHTKEYDLKPACQKKRMAAIKASTKLDDFEIEVTGEVKDDMIKVATLKILPSQD